MADNLGGGVMTKNIDEEDNSVAKHALRALAGSFPDRDDKAAWSEWFAKTPSRFEVYYMGLALYDVSLDLIALCSDLEQTEGMKERMKTLSSSATAFRDFFNAIAITTETAPAEDA